MTVRVVVHAGVDTEPTYAVITALRAAATTALERLSDGSACTGAAAAAVMVLEDEPELNAGYGSVLNELGEVEADAAVVDAVTQRFAGVAALSGVRHPVGAALALHDDPAGLVMLVGEGARQFALSAGLEPGDLRTDEQQRIWAHVREHGLDGERSVFTGRLASLTETVGAVVRDADGLAAAASTGGVLFKRPGRVGDSAVNGAGIHAYGNVAVLCSGSGEASIELQLGASTARAVADVGATEAARRAVLLGQQRRGMRGGVVVYDRATDHVAAAHNAASFPVVTATAGAVEVVEPVLVGEGR